MSVRKLTITSLTCLLFAAGACGDDGGPSSLDYPPFPAPTKGPDAAPRPTPDSAPTPPTEPATPLINEFARSNAGADSAEFIELLGDPSTDYSAYTILIVEGDNGGSLGNILKVYEVGTTDENGFFVTPLPTDDAIQNGSETFLLVKDFTGAEDDDLDDTGGTGDIGDGTLDTTPWSAVVDAVAVSDGGADDVFYVTIDSTTYGNALSLGTTDGGASRIPDGTDTDTAADWVIGPDSGTADSSSEANATPGAANTVGVDE